MFLKAKHMGHMVEVVNLEALFNLFEPDITGRDQVGEEAQEPETFHKCDLQFLSGEDLPRCWTDPQYRSH